MHQSILSYKRARYLLWASLMCIGAIAAYWLDDTAGPPNGGTALGYILGAIGALLILWLMWFGIRKRSYRSRLGSVQGWLSAHVYLGLGLITVVTLHTGFQFGWNVHTLAYVLMLLVVLSGLVGVFCYMHFPKVITDESGESSVESLIRQIEDIDRQALRLAGEIDDETHEKVLRSIRRNTIGGNWLQLLFARGRGGRVEAFAGADAGDGREDDTEMSETMMFMASHIARGRLDKGDAIRRLSDLLIGQKAQLQRQLRRNLQLKAFLDIWLYLHVPLSFALLAALIAHLVSVFFYR